jgi:hypothetical protein
MRWVLIVALVCGGGPATAQIWGQNAKCESACRSTLDHCAAVSNKIMEMALKEADPYQVGTSERDRVDIKFESAFLAGEHCWDRYHRCTLGCAPPKRCVDACQSRFRQCFAASERRMKEGLREMKTLTFGSPEWKAVYGKGDKDADRCLEDNRNCQGKCANP